MEGGKGEEMLMMTMIMMIVIVRMMATIWGSFGVVEKTILIITSLSMRSEKKRPKSADDKR